MRIVGWALECTDPQYVTLPGFKRYNVPKDAAERQRERRARNSTVTDHPLLSRDNHVTRGDGDGEESLNTDVDVKTGADVGALEDFEWDQIREDCKKINKSVPCRSKQDCSLIVKAAVLARTKFSQDWLWDAVEATRLKETDNKPRYFTGVLRSKCEELGFNLNALLKKIEIPGDYFRGVEA